MGLLLFLSQSESLSHTHATKGLERNFHNVDYSGTKQASVR